MFRIQGCVLALVLLVWTSPTRAQSFEDQNNCAGTTDDPCTRIGNCSIQGATWDQEVVIDRSDFYDTMGWAGLCDQVHVALVQGNCDPPQGQTNVIAYLQANSYATIPLIVGPLDCDADPTAAPIDRAAPISLRTAPNPFSGITQISFGSASEQAVVVTVFDFAGRRVKTLYEGASHSTGQSVQWSGRDEFGRDVASGIYWVVLRTGDSMATQRIAKLR